VLRGSAETVAHRFHQLTSYTLARHWLSPASDPAIRRDFMPMVEALRPPNRKSYPAHLSRIVLPAKLLDANGSFGAPAERDTGPNLTKLSWLLHWSAGVVRETDDGSGQRTQFRAASSAGNLHPIEVYVNAGGTSGLPEGVWYYDASKHELIRVGSSVADEVALILTGVPWRTEWRYAERGYRHIWWDAGSILAHIELLADVAGWPFKVRLDYPDSLVADVVGADELSELPLAVVHLDGQTAILRPGQATAKGNLGPAGPSFPLVRDTHEAARLADWDIDQESGLAGVIATPTEIASTGMSLAKAEELVRHRGTSRHFRQGDIGPDGLTWPLATAARPFNWDYGTPPVAFRVIVHSVANLVPGCYEYRDSSVAQVCGGDLRAEAVVGCLDQKPAGECAYVVLLAADLNKYLRVRGQRGYRALNLYAGVVAGRLQLAAAAAGLGSTPLTVRDEAAAQLVPAHMVPLLAVAVGRPMSAPQPAGPPRAATLLPYVQKAPVKRRRSRSSSGSDKTD
jgi:SagB-type dehydrogenase family enzyme